MDDQIAHLQRSVRRLQLAVAAMLLAGGVAVLGAFGRAGRDQEVIRTRGIVIVDAAGRERILIGAPVPVVASRVRTDIRRVEALWGARFPRAYITDYYPTYRNAVNGLLVLDEHGIDRLAIGDSVPDPNIGKRVGASTGIIINDAQGFERTGYGLLRVDTAYRVALGLDARGQDVVSLVVDDASGRRGINIVGDSSSVFIGSAPAGVPSAGIPARFSGLLLRNGSAHRQITAENP